MLLELARTVSTSYVPAELGRAIYAHVARVLPTTSFTVSLVRPEGELLPELHVGPGTGVVKLTPGERDHLLEGDFVVRARDTHVEILVGLTAESRLVGCLVARRGMAFRGLTVEHGRVLPRWGSRQLALGPTPLCRQ